MLQIGGLSMILKYLNKTDWCLFAVCVVFAVVQVYLELEIPGYMSSITTIITSGGSVDQVVNEGWGMAACAVGSLLAAIVTGYMAARIAASLSRTLRELQYDKVESFSMNEINRFSTASLITRSTNDITQIQNAVAMGMVVLIRAPVMAILAIMKITSKSWQWSATTAIAIVAILIVISVMMVFIVPRFKKIQWMTDSLNRVTRENLNGIRVVRAYNAEDYQEEKFEKANDDLTSNNLFTSRATALLMPTLTTIMSMLSLFIYWIGAYLISSAGMPAQQYALFSDMVVFSSYAIQIIMSFVMLVVIFMILPRAMVAAKRVEEVIDTEPSINDGTITESKEGLEGEISFKNVCFKYPNASDYVLKDINFDVHKGETIAFIGSTGSGKSTLINLVPRFYDATDGEILIDGVNIRDYTLESLHSKMGYVSQKAVMFAGTVNSNVKFGKENENATEDDVKKAISIAQAKDFVENLDGGYDGVIAQRGTNLSGGQKQRLSIARAVCRKPEFYIFDDSFSALDYKTDKVLRETLKKETGNVTSLIVAQRIGTIMDADKIVVLDNGNMVGIGTHRELLDNCPVYREIASSQLTEEELRR